MRKYSARWFEEYTENADILKPLTPDEWKQLAGILRELRAKLEQQTANYERVLRDRAKLREVVESIAKNTCCDGCQEASRVAQTALDALEDKP